MSVRADSKKETPRNLSILIALMQKGQLIHNGIISPTR